MMNVHLCQYHTTIFRVTEAFLFLDARNPLGLFSICHVLQQQATEGVVLFCEAYSIVYTSISWKKKVTYFLLLTFQYYLHF